MHQIIFQKKMIKVCEESLAILLKITFEAVLNDGMFPDDWKKGNIVPAHKAAPKTIQINYRPISLLPIFANTFEKIIFASMFGYISKVDFSQFFSLVFVQEILALCNFEIKFMKYKNQ